MSIHLITQELNLLALDQNSESNQIRQQMNKHLNQKYWHEFGVGLKRLIKLEGVERLFGLMLSILKNFNTLLDPFLILEIFETFVSKNTNQFDLLNLEFQEQFKNKPLCLVYINLIKAKIQLFNNNLVDAFDNISNSQKELFTHRSAPISIYRILYYVLKEYYYVKQDFDLYY